MSTVIKHSLTLLSSLLLQFGSATYAADLIPGTSTPAKSVMNELPWKFSVQTDKAGDIQIQRFRSLKPIRKTKTGGLYLRSTLTSQQFNNNDEAHAHFRQQASFAHPEMGLSYAWDYLIISDDHVHHLYGECTLSENNFRQMVGNLKQALNIPVDRKEVSIFCRCGGGCK